VISHTFLETTFKKINSFFDSNLLGDNNHTILTINHHLKNQKETPPQTQEALKFSQLGGYIIRKGLELKTKNNRHIGKKRKKKISQSFILP